MNSDHMIALNDHVVYLDVLSPPQSRVFASPLLSSSAPNARHSRLLWSQPKSWQVG